MRKRRHISSGQEIANERGAILRPGPAPGFDSTPCLKATLADLNAELISAFLTRARTARGLPIAENATASELLTHLNLLVEGHLTNAAVLLFGRRPQRFVSSSAVKCAHFHGTEVTKPIPSSEGFKGQVFKGTVFELVDQVVDFVMSRIKVANVAPVTIIPLEVVREAIVNAVAHRDYTGNGNVQVRLFADRVEIWNPGLLPPSLTLEMLRRPHDSIPRNPLLARALYLAGYTARVGTGTRDMIMGCRGAGLPVPQFALKEGFEALLRRGQQA